MSMIKKPIELHFFLKSASQEKEDKSFNNMNILKLMFLKNNYTEII